MAPVTALGLGKTMERKLHSVGIHSAEELAVCRYLKKKSKSPHENFLPIACKFDRLFLIIHFHPEELWHQKNRKITATSPSAP